MDLLALGPDGSRERIAHERFHWMLDDTWSLYVRLASFAHIPLTCWFELRRPEPIQEWYAQPGPRLVIGADVRGVTHVHVLDMRGGGKIVGVPRLICIAEDGKQHPVASLEFIAIVGRNDEVRIVFSLDSRHHPQVGVEGPRVQVPKDGSTGRAIMATCDPHSPFAVFVDFRECTVSPPDSNRADK